MSEGTRLADQLKRSVRGIAWHGPSIIEILGDVAPEEALKRPVPNVHSMAELVLHITAWMRAASSGLETRTTQLTAQEDWPPVLDTFDWDEAVAQLRDASKQLAERMKALADADLDRPIRGNDQEYSTYVLLHGVVQHNLYHAGQLALLKKALRTS